MNQPQKAVIGENEHIVITTPCGVVEVGMIRDDLLTIWAESAEPPVVTWKEAGHAPTNMAAVHELEDLLRSRLWWEHNASGELMDFVEFKERCMLAIDEIEAKIDAEVRQMDERNGR